MSNYRAVVEHPDGRVAEGVGSTQDSARARAMMEYIKRYGREPDPRLETVVNGETGREVTINAGAAAGLQDIDGFIEWMGTEGQPEGTEGQDRESYTDDQDRDSYVPDEDGEG